jgi:hypothetical protein
MLSACSNPHFFPHSRPLFSGLDEARVPARSQTMLAQAKADFQQARRKEEPAHASLVSKNSTSSGQISVYQGNGYQIEMVENSPAGREGPRIVIDPRVTGGKVYEYDEVKWTHD